MMKQDAKAQDASYLQEYARVVKSLVDGCVVSDLSEKERREQMSRDSREGKGCPAGNTEYEKRGMTLFTRTGHVWRDLGSASKINTAQYSNTDIQGPDRRGTSGLYQRLASKYNILPRDDMLAEILECSLSGITSARRVATQDGFEFKRIRLKDDSDTGHSWWKVVQRPKQEQTVTEQLAAIPKDELIKLLAGVLSN